MRFKLADRNGQSVNPGFKLNTLSIWQIHNWLLLVQGQQRNYNLSISKEHLIYKITGKSTAASRYYLESGLMTSLIHVHKGCPNLWNIRPQVLLGSMTLGILNQREVARLRREEAREEHWKQFHWIIQVRDFKEFNSVMKLKNIGMATWIRSHMVVLIFD